MALEDLVPILENFVPVLIELIRVLPLILLVIGAAAFVAAALFFGGIAVKGFRKEIRGFRILLVLASGVVCLGTGSFFYSLLPLDAILQGLFQGPGSSMGIVLDVIMFYVGLVVGALVSSIILALGFWLLTSGLEDKRFLKLMEDFNSLKGMLLKKKVLKHLSESEAKKIAAKAANGKAGKGKLVEDTWLVTVQKGNSEAKVMIDSVTGSVRSVVWHETKILNFFLSDKLRIIGLALIVFIGIVLVFGFQGFQTTMLPLEMVGLNSSFFTEFADAGSDYVAPEGCISMYDVQGMINRDSPPPEHSDPAMQQRFEEESGSPMSQMFLLEQERQIVLGVMEDSSVCYSQNGRFCRCMGTR